MSLTDKQIIERLAEVEGRDYVSPEELCDSDIERYPNGCIFVSGSYWSCAGDPTQ